MIRQQQQKRRQKGICGSVEEGDGEMLMEHTLFGNRDKVQIAEVSYGMNRAYKSKYTQTDPHTRILMRQPNSRPYKV
jgi:hypothetical protein